MTVTSMMVLRCNELFIVGVEGGFFSIAFLCPEVAGHNPGQFFRGLGGLPLNTL